MDTRPDRRSKAAFSNSSGGGGRVDEVEFSLGHSPPGKLGRVTYLHCKRSAGRGQFSYPRDNINQSINQSKKFIS